MDRPGWVAAQQHHRRGHSMGGGVREKDEDLALFKNMGKRADQTPFLYPGSGDQFIDANLCKCSSCTLCIQPCGRVGSSRAGSILHSWSPFGHPENCKSGPLPVVVMFVRTILNFYHHFESDPAYHD